MNDNGYSFQKKDLGILGLFLVLTLLATYPLIIEIGKRTFGSELDKLIFVWDLWWFKKAVLDLHTDPFVTDYMLYPRGTNLVFHTLVPLCGLIALPVTVIAGVVAAFNFSFMLAFALSGFFAYLLARELGCSTGAALFAGIVFGYCPARWNSAMMGHLNIISTQWMVLFLFFFWRSLRRTKKLDAVLAGVSLSLVAYTSLQLLIYGLTFAVLLGFFTYRGKLKSLLNRNMITAAALAAVVFAVASAPIIYHSIRQYSVSKVGSFPLHQIDTLSLGPGAIFWNFHFKRFWSSWEFMPEWLKLQDGPIVGYVTAILLLLGLFQLRRKPDWKPWYWVALVFLLLSFGPFIKIDNLSIPSLYVLFSKIPVFGSVRGVYRFALPMTLACALAAGLVLSKLTTARKSDSQRAARRRRVVLLLASAVVFFEFLRAPIGLSKPHRVPAVYEQLRGMDFQTGSLLELPFWISGADYFLGEDVRLQLYYQSVHEKRLLSGHVSRLSSKTVQSYSQDKGYYLLSLRKFSLDDLKFANNVYGILRANRVRYILFDRHEYPADELLKIRGALERMLPIVRTYEDGDSILYKVNLPNLREGSGE